MPERPPLSSFEERPPLSSFEMQDEPLAARGPAATEEKPEFTGSWSDVPAAALKNAPGSAVEFGKNIVQPFIHPIDTAKNLGQIGAGVMQHLGLMKGEEYQPHADAVGKFLMDRYGSTEGIKKTMATDPVGLAADLSMVLTGGGGLAARAPGLAGRAAEVAGTVGRVIDPLTVPIKAAGAVGSAIGRGTAGLIGGIGTHTGGESLIQAAKAGYEGGEPAAAFRENIRGIAPTEDAVLDAQRVMDGLRKERGADYRSAMAKLGENKQVLDFNKIDEALADATKVQTYKGQPLNAKTQEIRGEIGQAIQEWKMLDPAEYHTPEGLDALKRKIGDIRDDTQYGTAARTVADKAYHSIGNTIKEEAPEYAKIMKGYEQASKQLKTLERELSIPNPNKGNVDTALRKLQTALRNNVNANFGRRKELVGFLARNGAPNLMAKLAGQALQPALPRGLGKLAASLGVEGTAIAGGLGAGAGLLPIIGGAAFMSPRLMGEAAYWGGAGARQLGRLPRLGLPAFQAGRASEIRQQGGRVASEGYDIDSPEFKEEVRLALARNPDSPAHAQAQRNRRGYLPNSPESLNIEDRRGLRGSYSQRAHADYQRGGAVKISSRTGTHTIPVEIASTPAQQAKGLSGRRTLGKGRGMLFDLSSVRPTSFWMNNTYIPLDMIFIRADGRIAKIAENRKPLSRERVLSGGPVAKVLEVAAGTARRLRLMPGDRVA